MDKIYSTINQLIIETSGGVLVIWVASLYFLKKALRWCGTKIAEGANNDLIAKLLPQLESKFDLKFKNFKNEIHDDFVQKLEKLEDSIAAYKSKKHNSEGILAEYQEAIEIIPEGETINFKITDKDRFLLLKNLQNKTNVSK